MAKVLVGLLLCLMVSHSLQTDGRRPKNREKPSKYAPKTFKGNLNWSNKTRGLLRPSQQAPKLDVKPDDPASAFTVGVLSTRLIPSVYVLAMVVGIPSNIFILGFLRSRTGCFSTVVLYLSLALSDLLLLCSLALRVHYHLNGNNWVFQETACRLVTAIFYGNMYCSANTIACISLKRYLAVVRPFLYRRLPKISMSVAAIATVWVVFALALVPELLVRQSYELDRLGITTCHDVQPLEEASHAPLVPYRLALVSLGFIVPFVICICTHVSTVISLGRSGSNWAPFVRVSTLVFVIFAVCFTPSGVLQIVHSIRLLRSRDDGLYAHYRVAVCLCCLHCCLDPFLCVLMSRTAASKLKFTSLRVSQRTSGQRL